jgi:porin
MGAGVYSATPFEWGRIRGTTFGLEVGYVPRRSSHTQPGTKYRAGLWYQRAPLDAEAPGTVAAYAAIDQVLFQEGGGDQGLSGFLQAGTSSDAPNGVSDYVGAGLVYTGLVPGRDQDCVGLGVAHARLPSWAGRGPAETDIELLYRVTPWRWLTLQPSFHWLLRPGGRGPNAVVVGLRVETEF